MLHPVGSLPAAVYWRRRAVLLGLVLGVLVGGGWLTVALVTGPAGNTPVEAAATRGAGQSAATPSLEQVVPSLAAVLIPTVAPTTTPAPEPAAPAPEAPAPETPAPETPAAPALVDGGPCTDDMIAVEIRPSAPSVAVGSKPTLDLVITNISPVSCVRLLDKGLQEVVLLDAAGGRVWGSNDCFPESTSDPRTLAVGEVVVFPVRWGGLTSDPSCAAPRVTPPPGAYVLRGRLDTKLSADAALTLTA